MRKHLYEIPLPSHPNSLDYFSSSCGLPYFLMGTDGPVGEEKEEGRKEDMRPTGGSRRPQSLPPSPRSLLLNLFPTQHTHFNLPL